MSPALDRRAFRDAVRNQHEREPFSGVIDVRERGQVVLSAAFGWAQRAERIPNTPLTRFAIALGWTRAGPCATSSRRSSLRRSAAGLSSWCARAREERHR